MLRSETYRDHYTTFVNNIIAKGYASKVPEYGLHGPIGKVWYLPHHGAYNLKNLNKIRVVFDTSASYEGMSLKDHLLQGPDLTREETVAFIGDIEAVFYRAKRSCYTTRFLPFPLVAQR